MLSTARTAVGKLTTVASALKLAAASRSVSTWSGVAQGPPVGFLRTSNALALPTIGFAAMKITVLTYQLCRM
jgi:hypothetical protein